MDLPSDTEMTSIPGNLPETLGGRLTRGARSLARRVRGALALSAVTSVGTILVGGVLAGFVRLSSGTWPSSAAVLNGILQFGFLGFGIGLLSSLGILLAAQRRDLGAARAFITAGAATIFLWMATAVVFGRSSFLIAWIFATVLGVLVGAAAALLVRLSQRAEVSTEDDIEMDTGSAA